MIYNHNIPDPENYDFVKDTKSQKYYLVPNENMDWNGEKVSGYLLRLEGDTLIQTSDKTYELDVEQLESLIMYS